LKKIYSRLKNLKTPKKLHEELKTRCKKKINEKQNAKTTTKKRETKDLVVPGAKKRKSYLLQKQP
jgi:hypothetical protein